MTELLRSILAQVHLSTVVDIGITALLIYWLFSLIRGTRAVRLVIGVSVLIVVYFLAVAFNFILLTRILQGGAVVGLFALVVVFQPELRRALERIGRVGSFSWLLSPVDSRVAEHVADEVARAAAALSAEGHGALIVIERETGLEEVAETGVMVHGDLSADLLRTIFSPRTALHDGAVIIRGDAILAAGALLPLAEMTIHTERFGTRQRLRCVHFQETPVGVVIVEAGVENSSNSESSRSWQQSKGCQAALRTHHGYVVARSDFPFIGQLLSNQQRVDAVRIPFEIQFAGRQFLQSFIRSFFFRGFFTRSVGQVSWRLRPASADRGVASARR